MLGLNHQMMEIAGKCYSVLQGIIKRVDDDGPWIRRWREMSVSKDIQKDHWKWRGRRVVQMFKEAVLG